MLKLLTLIMCIFIIIYNYNRKQLASSSSIWIFAYILIMIVYPLYAEGPFNNESRIDLYAFLGIVFFAIGLLIPGKFSIKRLGDVIDENRNIIPDYAIAKTGFWIAFALSIVTLINVLGTEGIRSILSGITTSKQFSLYSDKSNTLYVFSVHLLVPCILAMWITAKTKHERLFSIFAVSIYVVETVLFGFTRLFLITIVCIIFLHQIRNIPQRKQVKYITVGIVSITLGMVFLNYVRSMGLRRIANFKNYLKIDYIFESTDFGASYHWFDVLLNYKSPYISLLTYLKPVFMLVPRSIWTNKPEPLSLQVLKYVDPIRAASGYSTAGNSVLGEGYAVLGYVGIVLAPFLWGIVCGSMDKAYFRRLKNGIDNSFHTIVYYIFAVFVVISGQRGDWSQYMGTVCWFYILPLYIMSKVTFRVNSRKHN